MLLAFLY